jgi:predicted lysophospholipase L1 biosynthesis ABC-type transport system permease subunit
MSSLFRIFRSILVGYMRYIVILSCTVCIVVALFTMVRQVTSSISVQVSLESRPIYGTDIQVRIPSLAATDTLQYIRSILPTDGVDITLRQQFNTTLINQSGTTSLVRIVAYSGIYPQRGILDIIPIYHTGYVLSGAYSYMQNLAITKNTYDMYASGGYIDIGGQRIRATHIISASSDNSISFGGDNHLIVLPRDSISGSLLLSSGARLDTSLYIQVAQDRDISSVVRTLQSDTRIGTYDISTYTQSQQATTGIVADLVDYILLILVVASVYSVIVIHSTHSILLLRMSSMLGILYRI